MTETREDFERRFVVNTMRTTHSTRSFLGREKQTNRPGHWTKGKAGLICMSENSVNTVNIMSTVMNDGAVLQVFKSRRSDYTLSVTLHGRLLRRSVGLSVR